MERGEGATRIPLRPGSRAVPHERVRRLSRRELRDRRRDESVYVRGESISPRTTRWCGCWTSRGRGQNVIVDLSRTTFMDSSGVRALMDLWHSLTVAGLDLVVRNPSGSSPSVRCTTPAWTELSDRPTEPVSVLTASAWLSQSGGWSRSRAQIDSWSTRAGRQSRKLPKNAITTPRRARAQPGPGWHPDASNAPPAIGTRITSNSPSAVRRSRGGTPTVWLAPLHRTLRSGAAVVTSV